MKAAPFYQHGHSDAIQYQESFPSPKCKKGEIVVDVSYCGINHLDIWTREGLPDKKIRLPHICGCDIVGHVRSDSSPSSESPSGAKKTKRVMVYPGISCLRCAYCTAGKENLCSKFSILGGLSDYNGGYAEQVAVPKSNIIGLPNSIDSKVAAPLAVSYLTAWNMLTTNLTGKDTSILVYGGASGVGMATIQLAKALGVQLVITTASNKSKRLFSKRLGADHVIDTTKNISAEVLEISEGKGVDLVIDHVGASTWQTSIASLRQGGRMAVCGVTSGNDATVPIRTFYTKQIIMTGALLGTKSQLVELLHFVVRNKIVPAVDSVMQLRDARKAQERMESGQHQGKILLNIPQDFP
jgi:NADPH:quinone reductase-like Zn-dependent oxidoreductase